MQKVNPFSAEETYLLPAIKTTRPRALLKNGFQVVLAYCGAAIILFVYFVVPLAQLFNFIGDWIAQVLCAFCILTLIEGSIGLVLLSIAKSVELDYKKHLVISDYTIDLEPTEILPAITLMKAPHKIELASTEILPAVSLKKALHDIDTDATAFIPTISSIPTSHLKTAGPVERGTHA